MNEENKGCERGGREEEHLSCRGIEGGAGRAEARGWAGAARGGYRGTGERVARARGWVGGWVGGGRISTFGVTHRTSEGGISQCGTAMLVFTKVVMSMCPSTAEEGATTHAKPSTCMRTRRGSRGSTLQPRCSYGTRHGRVADTSLSQPRTQPPAAPRPPAESCAEAWGRA